MAERPPLAVAVLEQLRACQEWVDLVGWMINLPPERTGSGHSIEVAKAHWLDQENRLRTSMHIGGWVRLATCDLLLSTTSYNGFKEMVGLAYDNAKVYEKAVEP